MFPECPAKKYSISLPSRGLSKTESLGDLRVNTINIDLELNRLHIHKQYIHAICIIYVYVYLYIVMYVYIHICTYVGR